ncbi:MAG TPA: S8 family serine peptidase [Gammaproteobacteria bacterium]|nr:S8 family serine peptidase [Gammaproteobacteria bacterium]
MRTSRCVFTALAAAASLAASAAVADSYIVVAKQGFGADFAARVEAAGGQVSLLVPQIGVAVVETDSPNFRAAGASIPGVQDVVANIEMRMIDPVTVPTLSFEEAFANPPASGDDDFYFDLQWGHQAIDAAGAWNLGHRGAGVRVAVLDSGIDADHPDLAPNINFELSRSFVPGEDWNVRPGSFFNHGTHVAGTIAAADNGFGTIGVAPEAELVALKVLSEFTGSGSLAYTAAAMVYAADIGADIVNMSLGATIPRNCTFDVLDDDGNPTGETEHFPARDCAVLIDMMQRAANYAYDNGVTLIASAGNEATDLDHNKSDVKLPAELKYVSSISATAPIGWAIDPFGVSFNNLASYSNYGKTGIDFSAPGGDAVYPGEELCIVAGVLQSCWVFDLVFSTSSGGWAWSGGTSMAAPHASGVAALIIGKNGGQMHPRDVVRELERTAVDFGRKKNDDVHGNGAVHALRAVAD